MPRNTALRCHHKGLVSVNGLITITAAVTKRRMGKDPAMLWYWGDWFSGTSLMSRHLKGCYMDLLHAQFNNGRLCLDEIKTVLGADFGAAWPTLQKKFVKDDSGLFFNKRCEEEKLKRQAFVKSRTKNLDTANHKPPRMDVHTEDGIKDEIKDEKKIGGAGGKIIEIGEKAELWVAIPAKYAGEHPRRIYDLSKYFDLAGQAEVFRSNGWAKKYKSFMTKNPGRVFDDENFLYNSFKNFCTNGGRNGKESSERTQSFGTDYGTGLTPVRGD